MWIEKIKFIIKAIIRGYKIFKVFKLFYQCKVNILEERMGFEPMKELLLYTLSKRAPLIVLGGTPTIALRNFQITVYF